MSKINNKFPGKDITLDDLKNKFPLCAKKNNKHQTRFKVNDIVFGGKLIPIIAGPNTVESEKFIFNVAKFLKKNDVHFLRGGAFKPLTFPYRSKQYFETREKGINWFSNLRNKIKIPVITEITEEKYIDLFCKSIDIIQIGSRNMQNFPLLRACAKTKKPIMLKRHFGCSLRDWLGAAEHILLEGNKKVILCERGIIANHTHRSSSRFLLDLQVIPAIKEISHLPVAVDPSHATFWEPWVESMTLASIAAGADAIMLEVHPNPKKSVVDPLQAMNFEKYTKLLKKMEKVANSIGRTIKN